jgi:hypothetical protein
MLRYVFHRTELVEEWKVKPFMVRQAHHERLNLNLSSVNLKAADKLESKTHTRPIKTLRGDYKDADGNTQNRLRRWGKHEFKPRPDDIFQERLYCIQWITS